MVKTFFQSIGKVITYIQNHFKVFLLVVLIILLLPSQDTTVSNLYKTSFKGIIDSEVASVFIQELENVEDNDNIKGILIEVDSGGGAVAPSVELYHTIKRISKKKPIVIYNGGVMASGSYYMGASASKIIANPGSITGSIGVIFQGYNVKELMDKIGIKPQILKVGKYKEVGTVDRAWEDYEKEELQKTLDDIYELFVSNVAMDRNLSIAKEKTFADAKIFSAKRALKVGLVDKIGTFYDAKKELVKISKVENAVWSEYEESFDQKISNFFSSTLNSIIYNFLSSKLQ